MEFEFGIVGEDLCENDDCVPNLPVRATALEFQRASEIGFNAWGSSIASEFQNFLHSLVGELQPSEIDHFARIDIINRLSSIAANTVNFKEAKLSTFGSFESNIYTRWADLDISLEVSGTVREMSKNVKAKILRSFLNDVICKDKTRNVQFIRHARVPLITFDDACHNVSCDISISNGMGILKSRILRWISEIDSRCRDLIFLVKFWAKVHHINDPKSGTLNSFALSLLVVFHLQTRAPPILPPLSAFLDEDILTQLSDPQIGREKILDRCWMKIQPYIVQNFGDQNKASVAELFISFFNQFSAVTSLWRQGLSVCTFNGSWGDRMTTSVKWGRNNYIMAVEDPFDRTDNCARSVQDSTVATIFRAFESSANVLCSPFPDCSLSELLGVIFLCPVEMPSLRLQPWLATVYSQTVKMTKVEIKRRDAGQDRTKIMYSKNKNTNKGSFIELETFLQDHWDQLQITDTDSTTKAMRKGKKTFAGTYKTDGDAQERVMYSQTVKNTNKGSFVELETFLQDHWDQLQITDTDSTTKAMRKGKKTFAGTYKTDGDTQERVRFPGNQQETLDREHLYCKDMEGKREKASTSRSEKIAFGNKKTFAESREQVRSDASANEGRPTNLTVKESHLTESKHIRQRKLVSNANQGHTFSNTQNSKPRSYGKHFSRKKPSPLKRNWIPTGSNSSLWNGPSLESSKMQPGGKSKEQVNSSSDSKQIQSQYVAGISRRTFSDGKVSKHTAELDNATEIHTKKKTGKIGKSEVVHGEHTSALVKKTKSTDH